MARVRAPEFPQHSLWLNKFADDETRPLSLKELRGRIVLLDFWSYCCINCLHALPDLKYLEQKYKNSLTVIGVHSGKFDHEKNLNSIRQAVLRYDIKHPVLVDNDFRVWQDYAVRAYPTFVVIDPQGYVVASVSGEGKREFLEQLIETLIQEHQGKGTIDFKSLSLTLEKQHPQTTPLAFPGKVLADESSDRLFIADSGHHRIVVTTLNGELLQIVGTGKPGFQNGSFTAAQFSAPQGMTLDRAKQILYVADTENHALRRVDLRRETVETIAGTGEQSPTIYPHSGKALEIPLNSPWDLELVDDNPSKELRSNRLLIAMAGSHQIWQMQLAEETLSTYAGTGAEGWADGLAAEAAFAQPSGITTGKEELFVADSEISSVRAVGLQLPEVCTVCGSGDLYGFGDTDGMREAVRLQHCLGIEYADGTLWVADTYNHKIKRLDPVTGFCQTIVGDGQAGFVDGEVGSAQFSEPSGLSATKTHLYVADTNNHAIRRVDLNTLSVTTLRIPDLCAPDICVPKGL